MRSLKTQRSRRSGLLIVITLAAPLLGSCASTVARLPASMGGEPEGIPERTATPVAYPAVHDMPPPRTDAVLTEQQRQDATKELDAIRARQAKQLEDAKKTD